jgi:hypothetical protein
MFNSPFYSVFQISSLVASLVIAGFWFWIAAILLRWRTVASWMVLVGAILSLGSLLFSSLGWPLLVQGGKFNSESFYWINSTASIVSRFLLVGGLLMHFLRVKSESERIAELEAIIRDRDGMS